MIVNQTQNGWEIIYHRAHALLAAQLAGQWRRKNAPERLYETLAAISHHDDLEREWEENQLTPAGAPLDFTLDDSTSIERLEQLLDSARYRGRWVTLLTSRHICFLNEGKRSESKEIAKFLDKQYELHQQWQQELGISQEDVDAAYAFMQLCDRLSLILCQQQIPVGERALEIAKGPDGKRYDIIQTKDGTLTVTPWPFEDPEFTVNVEATELNQIQFDDNNSLTQALQSSPIKVLEWTFAKQ